MSWWRKLLSYYGFRRYVRRRAGRPNRFRFGPGPSFDRLAVQTAWERGVAELVAGGTAKASEVDARTFMLVPVCCLPKPYGGLGYRNADSPTGWSTGDFDSGKWKVTFCAKVPEVLVHEAQHAILWVLRDPRWEKVGHA